MLNLLLFIEGILYRHWVIDSSHNTWGRRSLLNCFISVGAGIPLPRCLELRCINSSQQFFIKWSNLNFGHLRRRSFWSIFIAIDYIFHFFFDLVKALFRLWMILKMYCLLGFRIRKAKLRWADTFESTLHFILETLIKLLFFDFGYSSFNISYNVPLCFWPSIELTMWFQNRLLMLHPIFNLLT